MTLRFRGRGGPVAVTEGSKLPRQEEQMNTPAMNGLNTRPAGTRHPQNGSLRRWGLALVAAGLLLGAPCASAQAGEWVQVSCVNPDGSGAGSSGWVSMIAGGGYGSNTDTACGPGAPMYAILSSDAAVGTGSAETLHYIPPAGSTLNGGEVNVALFADGGGYNASGTAVLYSPEYVYDAANVFFQCAAGLPPCTSAGYDFLGSLAIPPGRGGELYVSAGCGGAPGASCDEHPSQGAWSLVQLSSASLRLSNSATPAAGSISGTLLDAGAHGTARLLFAATDPGGPGIYNITVQADGRTLYSATPEANEGRCAAVGSSSGAWMFDSAQPCKQSEQVDLPLDTTSLADGPHTLTVTATDAAQNSSVVLDRTITTANAPPTTSTPGVAQAAATANGAGASEQARIRLAGQTSIARVYRRGALTISGHLESSAGQPIAGARLEITQRPASSGSAATVLAARTAPDGSFTAHVPAGPSRSIVIGYRARPGDASYAAQASVKETVNAGVHIAITPHQTASAGTITIRGAVSGPVPRQGVTVELLVHYHGQWAPFRDAHVPPSGRFHVRYQFQGARGRFPFKARVIGEQGGYPYATGQSNTVQVSTR